MGLNLELLREYLVLGLDVIKRRWLLFLVPPLLASGLAAMVVMTAPMQYTARSQVLFQNANRPTAAVTYSTQPVAGEQLQALETWMKSEQFLLGVANEVYEGLPADPNAQRAVLPALRHSLKVGLIGNWVFEITLDSNEPRGLGRKLEGVVARLMESLTGPDKGLFNATQFVLAARKAEMAAADAELTDVLAAFPQSEPIMAKLRQLDQMTQSSDRNALPASVAADAATQLRREIAEDPAMAERAERAYRAQKAARSNLESALAASANPRAYVGIFAAPENLVVIGRPQDPTVGQYRYRKMIVAGLLLSVLLALGLVALVEILGGRLRSRGDYEKLTGLPVVARFPKISPA